MTVLIRADATPEIGTGHVMRCLALADALRDLGARPVFAGRDMFPAMVERIRGEGFAFAPLPEAQSDNAARASDVPHAHWLKASWRDDAHATLAIAEAQQATWVVVDHYGIDHLWEAEVQKAGLKVAALDDLADRRHAADLLSDPSLTDDPHGRYRDLTASAAQRLFGPRYALLRSEFTAPPERSPPTDGLRVLVAFGGVDAAGMTERAMEALAKARSVAAVDVVIGGQNQRRSQIEAIAKEAGWRVHVNTSDIATLMAAADLGVGAGGHMLWERAAMGLPSLAAIVADNQRTQVSEAAKQGVVIQIDPAADADALAAEIDRLAADTERLARMAAAGRQAVDRRGAGRIARRIVGPEIGLRRAEATDCDRIHAWRNDPHIRRFSRDAKPIDLEGHRAWFGRILADESRTLLIGDDASGPLGVLRYDRAGDVAEVSIYLAPDRLGSGLGADLLLAGDDWVRQNSPETRKIIAEVLPGNAASEELFQSCGYWRGDAMFEKRWENRP